jgi:hypothetical protein
VLLERAVTAADGAERLVDDETRRARRALVDRENHSRPNGNANALWKPPPPKGRKMLGWLLAETAS